MSHLHAPGGTSGGREGGRHSKPGGRGPALPEAGIRAQLLRLAVVPSLVVTLGVLGAVALTLPDASAALVPLAAGALAGLLLTAPAAVQAARSARILQQRIGTLRRNTARGQAEVRRLVDALSRGEQPPARVAPQALAVSGEADSLDLLGGELARAQESAVAAVVKASRMPTGSGSEQKLEVFVSLARRLQSLVHREISVLDELENEVEDPDLLKGLFHVDHLATRIRRHAENLAVLGGAMSRRQWSRPVSMTELLRSAVAEVEQYARVKLVPPIQGTVRGHAVADVIHLLAELVENATVFSAPKTEVLLRVNPVAAGLAVEVEDRGLGMPVHEQNRMNALLDDPGQVDVASLLQDGRIGLYVVSQLARRHGIVVKLQANIYGGVQAVLVLPTPLLGGPGDESADTGQRPALREGELPAPRAAEAPVAVAAGVGASRSAAYPEPAAVQSMGGSETGIARAGAGAAAVRTGPRSGEAGPVRRRPSPDRTGLAPEAGEGRVPLPVRKVSGPGMPAPGSPRPGSAEPATPPREPRSLGTGAPETRTPVAAASAAPARGPQGEAPRTLERPPRLPRRRAQQNLVPQLRQAPVWGAATAGSGAPHDPGLMAAFRRGVSRAEEQTAAMTPHHQGAPGPGPGPMPPR